MTFLIIQWNPSLYSWSISSPRSCTRNKEKLSDRFWENWQKVTKQPNFTLFWAFRPWKIPSERFNQIHLLTVHQHPPSCQNREKNKFLWKLPQSEKSAKCDLSDLYKWHLGWFNKIHIFTVHWYLPKEASCHKRKIVIRPFLRNHNFKWKVDETTTEGRLGIRKAASKKWL